MKQFKNFDELKHWCLDNDHSDALLFADPDYSSAVAGMSSTGALIYSHEKMVEWLMQNYGLDQSEAIDFIEVNTIRALPYGEEKKPVIMYDIDI